MLSKDFFRRLELPFPVEDVSVRIGSKRKDGTAALPLFYLQAEAVRQRFDMTCTLEGATWSYDFTIVASPSDHVATNIDSKALAVKATITVQKDGVSISRSSIGEETFAREENTEVYKSAETDAFKRAAARFGIGGYLRTLPKMWFPLNDKGFFSDSEDAIIKKVYNDGGVNVVANVLATETVVALKEGIDKVKDSLTKPCVFLEEAFVAEFEKKHNLKKGSWWSIQTVMGMPIRSLTFDEIQHLADVVAKDVNESNFETALVLSKALPIAAQYPEHFGKAVKKA